MAVNSMDYHEIVRRLIGKIEPVGETNEDAKRYKNLLETQALVDALLADIDRVALLKDRQEASIAKCGKSAAEFLQNVKEA